MEDATILMILAAILVVLARKGTIRPGRKFYETATSQQESRLLGDDPILDVLHRALGDHTGKLRVFDAYRICGIEPSKANQDQIVRFSNVIRELGWARQRRRFDGALQHAYVKGTAVEREVEILVEHGALLWSA